MREGEAMTPQFFPNPGGLMAGCWHCGEDTSGRIEVGDGVVAICLKCYEKRYGKVDQPK